MDKNQSGDVDETEFILFMLEYNKKLSEREYEKFIGKVCVLPKCDEST